MGGGSNDKRTVRESNLYRMRQGCRGRRRERGQLWKEMRKKRAIGVVTTESGSDSCEKKLGGGGEGGDFATPGERERR